MPKKKSGSEDPGEAYAQGIKDAVKELQKVFRKQGHSGHSAYCTMLGFVSEYFEGNIDPAWIVSKSPAIVTVGEPQTLDIIPLNKEAQMHKLNVTVTPRINEKMFRKAWDERPKKGRDYDRAKWILHRYLQLVGENGGRKETH